MTEYKKVSYFFEMYFRIFRIFVFWYLYLYYVLILCYDRCRHLTIPYLPPENATFLYSPYMGENRYFERGKLQFWLNITPYYLYLERQILNSNPHYYTNVSYVTDTSS